MKVSKNLFFTFCLLLGCKPSGMQPGGHELDSSKHDDSNFETVKIEEWPAWEETLSVLKNHLKDDERALFEFVNNLSSTSLISQRHLLSLSSLEGANSGDLQLYRTRLDVWVEKAADYNKTYPRSSIHFETTSKLEQSLFIIEDPQRITFLRRGHAEANRNYQWYVYASGLKTILNTGDNPSKAKLQALLDYFQDQHRDDNFALGIQQLDLAVSLTPFLSSADLIAKGELEDGLLALGADAVLLVPFVGGATKAASLTRVILYTASGSSAAARSYKSIVRIANGQGSVVDGAEATLGLFELVLALRGIHTDVRALMPKPKVTTKTFKSNNHGSGSKVDDLATSSTKAKSTDEILESIGCISGLTLKGGDGCSILREMIDGVVPANGNGFKKARITERLSQKFVKQPKSIKRKFLDAMKKGLVSDKGESGIKRMPEDPDYQFKVKVLGKGGDIRFLGNVEKNSGDLVFSKVATH